MNKAFYFSLWRTCFVFVMQYKKISAGVIQKGLYCESGAVQARHFLPEVVAHLPYCACRMCLFDKLDQAESNLAAVIVQFNGSSEDENTERLWKEELALCNARLALLGKEA
jgi:hypothetical protein